MAKINVQFDRTGSEGLFASVYINKEYLPFDGNGTAFKALEPGKPVLFDWQLQGQLGDTFTLVSKPTGALTTIARSTVPASGKFEDFNVNVY